jgi:predicted membrane GTPase involved in stress response
MMLRGHCGAVQTPLPTSTIAAPSVIRPLFADPIDPPTISMNFGVNDSLLAGKDGTSAGVPAVYLPVVS